VLKPVYDRRHRRHALKEETCHEILREAQSISASGKTESSAAV
jgi:hypothetical protein